MTGSKILVVEDERIVALDLKAMLEGMGCIVPAMAASFEEAVAAFDAHAPDLVLMDIMLEGPRTGIEAAAAMLAKRDVPIVYLTAYGDEDMLRRAQVTDPHGYVLKPFHERSLHLAIEMALYRHRSERRTEHLGQVLRALRDVNQLIVHDGEPATFAQKACELLTRSRGFVASWIVLDGAGGQPGTIGCAANDPAVERRFRETYAAGETPACVQHLPPDQAAVFARLPEWTCATCPGVACAGAAALLVARIARGGRTYGHMASYLAFSAVDVKEELSLYEEIAGDLAYALEAREVALARREADRKVAANAVFVDTLLDHLPTPVFHKDADLRYQGCNSAFEALTGVTRKQLVGRRAYELWPEAFSQVYDARDRELLQNGGHQEYETKVVDAQGETRDVVVRKAVVSGPTAADAFLVGTVYDMTALRKAAAERTSLEDMLAQAQKMEAIGRLAGGVAHDFNNLLTAIIGYGGLLAPRVADDPTLWRYVDQILHAARSGATLTAQLLSFSRKQIVAPRRIDMNQTIEKTEGILRRVIGEDVDLLFVPGGSLGTVNMDPGQVDQILMNLAVNARDAMPQGGALTVETANAVVEVGDCRSCGEHVQGSYVVLTVSDDGNGISQEHLERVFEPFFTTKRVGEGTGLGLATVHGIVHQAGGHLNVYSEVGVGTTFRIYLPRVDAPADVPTPEVAPRREGTGETILVAEDMQVVRELVVSVLEQAGYRVLAAADGGAALELARGHDTPIHLLLTDVIMPTRSGRELAAALRERHPELRVLYMSGYTEDAIVHHGVLEAGVNLLRKPFHAAELLQRVGEVLEG